jgi:hypothetical protein
MTFIENATYNPMSVKGINVKLFILKETKVVTQEIFDDYEMFEDEEENIYYVEHSMINSKVNLVRPMLISTSEMPLKGDKILRTNEGNSIEIATRNLSNKDIYSSITNKREIYKIIVNYNEFDLKNHIENIKKGSWVHGQQFFVECENSVYDKNRLKEVDYTLYDSSLNIFKIKEPIKIHLF